MTKYAEGTKVSTESSKAEIERTLTRYGATSFFYGWDDGRAVIQFKAAERIVRFTLVMPDRNEKSFTHYRRGGEYGTWYARTEDAALAQWEQACRQRWRALALVIKAKLEAVASGISEFEDEFLAHVVLPDRRTVGEWIRPQLADVYETGDMPPMLPQLGSGGSHQ